MEVYNECYSQMLDDFLHKRVEGSYTLELEDMFVIRGGKSNETEHLIII